MIVMGISSSFPYASNVAGRLSSARGISSRKPMQKFYKAFPWVCLIVYVCICIFAPLALVGIGMVVLTIMLFDVELHLEPRWNSKLPSVREAKKRIERIQGKDIGEPRHRI